MPHLAVYSSHTCWQDVGSLVVGGALVLVRHMPMLRGQPRLAAGGHFFFLLCFASSCPPTWRRASASFIETVPVGLVPCASLVLVLAACSTRAPASSSTQHIAAQSTRPPAGLQCAVRRARVSRPASIHWPLAGLGPVRTYGGAGAERGGEERGDEETRRGHIAHPVIALVIPRRARANKITTRVPRVSASASESERARARASQDNYYCSIWGT
eukprot:scaffold23796_cov144-Isochrysis_galbana.AAC.3